MESVNVNRVYKHHSGTEYHPICITNKSATKPGWEKNVVYTDENKIIYSRPESEFLKKVKITDKPSMHKKIIKLLNK